MKTLYDLFLLLVLLAIVAGGCTTQPPAQSQADFDAEFILKTVMGDGKMVFEGVGGGIAGLTNPDLTVQPGDRVRLVILNGDGMPHDLAVPDLGAQTAMVMKEGDTSEVIFEANHAGVFPYICTVSGHRQAGMEGRLVVGEPE